VHERFRETPWEFLRHEGPTKQNTHGKTSQIFDCGNYSIWGLKFCVRIKMHRNVTDMKICLALQSYDIICHHRFLDAIECKTYPESRKFKTSIKAHLKNDKICIIFRPFHTLLICIIMRVSFVQRSNLGLNCVWIRACAKTKGPKLNSSDQVGQFWVRINFKLFV
jgi:hypothetical protein